MKNIRIYAFLPPFVLLTIAAAYSLVIGMRNETKAIAFLSHLVELRRHQARHEIHQRHQR